METKKAFGNDLPDNPKKHIPAKPDKDPDSAKKKQNQPEKVGTVKINEPQPACIESQPSSPKE